MYLLEFELGDLAVRQIEDPDQGPPVAQYLEGFQQLQLFFRTPFAVTVAIVRLELLEPENINVISTICSKYDIETVGCACCDVSRQQLSIAATYKISQLNDTYLL